MCVTSHSIICRVVLESLSPEVAAIVEEHNAEALHHFLGYIRDYVEAHIADLPPGNTLPMSGICFPAGQPGIRDANGKGGALHEFRKEVVIASPFVALSGE